MKVKCTRREAFIILGRTASKSRGRPFASLLVGQYDGETLVYKGKVGTGFDAPTMAALITRLDKLKRKRAPAQVPEADARSVAWVKPTRVAEIAFSEFTDSGRIRHGSFAGLRGDGASSDVAAQAGAPLISHRERVVYPQSGHTKGQLADYYAAIGDVMLPFAAGRPVSLLRCPQGRAKRCFFQKHDSGSFGPEVAHVQIAGRAGGTDGYLYIEQTAGLLACVQMGTIEFHSWGSRVDALERPDRMVFDLDPDEGLSFAQVTKAALTLRSRLSDIGLVAFAMLSGGKGVHVIVPLTGSHDWETHKDFARRFAEALSLAEPDRFVATMSKSKRRGKIFIDWLRDQRGATAVLPYSARARDGAPVAAPIGWDELAACKSAGHFSIDDSVRLIERARSKSLAQWGFAKQGLPDL